MEELMSDVVDRASTPDESAALSAAQTKLGEMLGSGKAAPTAKPTGPPAHVPSAQREHPGARVADARTAHAEAAAVSPAEQRIKRANANPALWDTNHKDHDAARQELRAAVAAADTPEEAEAFRDAPVQDQRAFFGMAPPTLPPSVLENYEAAFSDWERDFLAAAREHGLANDLVRDLRDTGVQLGMQVDGRPLDDATLDHALGRFGSRLNGDQKKHLKAYWRRIEGGSS
jgi:hypothetical protein